MSGNADVNSKAYVFIPQGVSRTAQKIQWSEMSTNLQLFLPTIMGNPKKDISSLMLALRVVRSTSELSKRRTLLLSFSCCLEINSCSTSGQQ